MPDRNDVATLIRQIADLLRGPHRPPQYERVMLPMTMLRRFDCVLAPTKPKVLAELRACEGQVQARRARTRGFPYNDSTASWRGTVVPVSPEGLPT